MVKTFDFSKLRPTSAKIRTVKPSTPASASIPIHPYPPVFLSVLKTRQPGKSASMYPTGFSSFFSLSDEPCEVICNYVEKNRPSTIKPHHVEVFVNDSNETELLLVMKDWCRRTYGSGRNKRETFWSFKYSDSMTFMFKERAHAAAFKMYFDQRMSDEIIATENIAGK